MNTKITIVTPSYNQVRFLPETIRSVISQREYLHEYFVLDGGSSDGSNKVLESFADQLDWWVSEKDRGQSDALAKGFNRSTGDVLGWINSDDILLPGALSRVKALFDSDPSLDIVTGYLVFIDSESRLLSLPRVPTGINFLARNGVVQVSQQSTFFRRSLYEKVGGIDLTLHCAMDYDLWTKFYLAGARWGQLPVHIAGFRKHEEAKGSGNQWWELYQAEKSLVQKKYPDIYGDQFSQKLSMNLYRLMQLCSGRHLKAKLDTLRLKGKFVSDVFGIDE